MIKSVPILILALLILFGCKQSEQSEIHTKRFKPERNEQILARVNGVPIYQDELKGNPLNSLITNEILYQEGLRLGLDKKYEEKVMSYQMSLVVNEMKSNISKEMPPTREVSEEEIESYYKEAKLKYSNARLQGICFSDKDLKDEIYKMAAEGTDFQDIANKYLDSKAKVVVEDIGYNRELNKYLKKIEVGAMTEVIEKRDGTYCIIKIVSIQQMPIQSSKKAIKNILRAQRNSNELNNYARQLAKEKNMDIVILNTPN